MGQWIKAGNQAINIDQFAMIHIEADVETGDVMLLCEYRKDLDTAAEFNGETSPPPASMNAIPVKGKLAAAIVKALNLHLPDDV